MYEIIILPQAEKEIEKLPQDYRVIYHIENQQMIITIIKTAHRSKVYRNK